MNRSILASGLLSGLLSGTVSAVALMIAGGACANRGDSPAPERSSPSAATDPDERAENPAPAQDAAPALPVADDRGPERAVYSFADNRLIAHVGREGGLLVQAGSAGFAKYLRFPGNRNPWELSQERDGVPVARMKGPRASLRVPLTREQAAGDVSLALRVYSPSARRVSIAIGGGGSSPLTEEIDEGWSTIELSAGEERLAAGENDLELIAPPPGQLELAWLQVGGSFAEGDLEDDLDPIFADDALLVPEAGELTYYVMIPEGGRVTGDLDEIGCEVEVEAATDEGEPVRGTLTAKGSAVELEDLGGEVVRLSLSASGCASARLKDAALAVAGEAPAPPEDAPPPRYALLWIMDSLRADRVRPFNPNARPKTPIFDALAETSAVFTQAYVQGNESRASHAAIWSSLYGARHGMPQKRKGLGAQWTTLDEVMKAAGMFTSGVSGNGYVTARSGFGTNWDRYRNHIHLEAGLQGDRILEAALASVGDVDDPWFVYLGTIDTHVSWRAKKPWIDEYDPEPYQGRFQRVAAGPLIDRIAAGAETISQRDIERIRAIYDSNVSYQDMLLGELLAWLEGRGIGDETMIIITADHGDELWEAGRVGHGGSLRDSVVHVPLLVHYPPLVPAGPVSEGTEVIDVVPTFADALGVDHDDEWQGESLLPLAQGAGRGYPRLSLASLYERVHAARVGPWKIHVSGRERPKLFNVGREPDEKTNVVDDYPHARRFVEDALWTLRVHNEAWRKQRWGNASNMRAAFPADMGE